MLVREFIHKVVLLSLTLSITYKFSITLDVQYVSEAYRIDFEDLESEFVQLFIDVTEIIKKNKRVTKKKLKQFLSVFVT